jgi:peptide-methionine (S)-S-oxide reductase
MSALNKFVIGLAAVAGLIAVGALVSTADVPETPPPTNGGSIAVFAGGCFWCMEPPYDELAGVLETTSGYIGGHAANPSYKEVTSGRTGHAEAVAVRYEPALVSYNELLEVFWQNVDPFAVNRQFCDTGNQYRSAIFYGSDEEKAKAEASLAAVAARFDKPIATTLEPAGTFYLAEEYHQDYYRKNPIRYKYYRTGCGRDARLKAIWGEN